MKNLPIIVQQFYLPHQHILSSN